MAKKAISKGITMLVKGASLFAGYDKITYEARVEYQGKSSNAKLHSLYVGTYSTLDKAIVARNSFIVGLF